MKSGEVLFGGMLKIFPIEKISFPHSNKIVPFPEPAFQQQTLEIGYRGFGDLYPALKRGNRIKNKIKQVYR